RGCGDRGFGIRERIAGWENESAQMRLPTAITAAAERIGAAIGPICSTASLDDPALPIASFQTFQLVRIFISP
ncbi:MAG: hypothetical protein ACREFM_25850, partial [Hypericibacter sp.]